jgi:hypothetical protein
MRQRPSALQLSPAFRFRTPTIIEGPRFLSSPQIEPNNAPARRNSPESRPLPPNELSVPPNIRFRTPTVREGPPQTLNASKTNPPFSTPPHL